MNLPQFYVDEIIVNALKEDINYVDVASDYLIPEDPVSYTHLTLPTTARV